MALWEANHPYYGAGENEEKHEDFSSLKDAFAAMDEDLNFIYRWDWKVQDVDDLEEGDDPRDRLEVFYVQPRRERLWMLSCPLDRSQHDEVLEWLKSDRVLGYMRTMWAPLLDADA